MVPNMVAKRAISSGVGRPASWIRLGRRPSTLSCVVGKPSKVCTKKKAARMAAFCGRPKSAM